MKCTGSFKELSEGKMAYATVVGSIEQRDFAQDEIGFYPEETESWITVLCEEYGMEIHKFIAEQLQDKHL